MRSARLTLAAVLAVFLAASAAVAAPPATRWFLDAFGSYIPGTYGLNLQNAAPNWQAAPEGGSNSQLRVVNDACYGDGPDYTPDGNYVQFKGDSHIGNNAHCQTAASFASQSAGKLQVFHLRARGGFTPFPGRTGWFHASFAIRDASNVDIACWAGGSLGLKSHLTTAPIVYPTWDRFYYGLLPDGWVGGPTPTDTTPGVAYLFPDAGWHDFDITYDPATGVTKWYADGTLLWTQTQAAGRAANKIWVRDVCVHNGVWAWEDRVLVDEVSLGTPGAPIISTPTGNAIINNRKPTIIWSNSAPGDPLVSYQVKICSTDSASGAVVHDSGTVSGSATIHTVTTNLPTDQHLWAFVRERHTVSDWSNWSPTGAGGFTVSTTMPGPGPLVTFTATPGLQQNVLNWQNPSDAGFTGTRIRFKTTGYPTSPSDGTLVIDKANTPGSSDTHTHTGLTGGVTYYYSAFAHDATPNYATQLYASAVPSAPDTTPPAAVSAFNAVKGDGQNTLSWHNPGDSDFVGVIIRYKTTGYPTSVTDGTLLVNRTGAPSAADNYTHTGTSNEATYYYAAFTYDEVPNYSSAATAAAIAASPGLRIHPENPHYFQDALTGKPILVAGYTSIVPSDTSYDYVAGDALMRGWRIGYSRVWHFLPWAGSNAVWPWGRSSTPGAPMGGNKIDMNTWNATYWNRLRDGLSRAETAGILAEIHLFDRCGMSPASSTRWQGNPWATDNNINNLETPPASSDGTPEFYDYESRPNLRNQQERYIRKMIDETIAYTNVIYEVENEHWQYDDPIWGAHYAQFVKNYINTNYPTSPRLVTYNSLDNDLESFYTISWVDVVNKHYGNEAETNPSILNSYIESRWGLNKAINVDEFANGVTDGALMRNMCWTIIASGGNYHIEDAEASISFEVCANIRSFIATSGWDFVHAAPNKNLITSGGGYCMAQPGVEYVCYFPTGGSKTITLSAGAYRAEWWNPATGGFYNITSFTHGGGARTLSSPNSSDWVLHLATMPAPTTVLESKAAGAITIDGSTGDWNLSQLTARIRAGDTGTGQVGVVGYDTNGVCYQGNHGSGQQYPPANAADHSAKIYSRNDASYLYLLVRCDDSDMRYPNGVDTNWANDCVEIYLDPGHDHGATSMANSSSDVQIVIDANNQKNVYMTTTAYRTQVLNGITSAVVRDASGWWLEARIAKNALTPALPATGTIGLDFNFRDNDNNDAAVTTIYTWNDSSAEGFPSKVPNRWGNLSLTSGGSGGDTTPPGPIAGFTASPGSGQIALSWTNPPDSDFTAVMIRYRTDTYPTGIGDGSLVIDKPGAPGAPAGHTHTGLTPGTTYYYRAFAHDVVPNYAAGVTASAALGGSTGVISNSTFDSGEDGWTTSVWRAGDTYAYGTMAWASSGGNPTGCMASTGSGVSDNDSRCLREGGEISKTISTVGHTGIRITYDLKVNGLGNVYTGAGSESCAVDHNLIDEQLTVFYSTNGGASWNEAGYLLRSALLASYQNYGTRTINLSGITACNENASFALRFRWQFNQATDSGWLDNIKVEGIPTADTTAPGPVTGFAVRPGSQANNLSWTNPTASDFAGVKILYKTTGYPTGPTDGAVAYTGNGTSFRHTGLANGTPCYYAAYAYDEVPNYSTAAQASATPVYFCTRQAKLCANNTAVNLTVGTVSAIGADWFYAQCPDPTCGPCGIRVQKTAHGLTVGQSCEAQGTVLTDNTTGEKYVAANWLYGSGSLSVPALAMSNLVLGGGDWFYNTTTGAGQRGIEGGIGTNNIGLLVRVWGRVTQRDMSNFGYFYVDDGGLLRDTTITGITENVGIRIQADPTAYAAGSYVVVTGVSGCFEDASGKLRRKVIPLPNGILPVGL